MKKTIKSNILVHSRPAAMISQMAKTFNCKSTVLFGDKKINPQSIMQLVSSGINKGDWVTIEAEGKDAQTALEALEVLFKGMITT